MRLVLRDASTHRAKAQYKSAVWAQNEEQAAVARRVAEKLSKTDVPVLAPSQWWDAEEYHRTRSPHTDTTPWDSACFGGCAQGMHRQVAARFAVTAQPYCLARPDAFAALNSPVCCAPHTGEQRSTSRSREVVLLCADVGKWLAPD